MTASPVNKYSLYSSQQLEELFANFLIDSWSYSAVTTFARNEKEFERRYIYCEPSRKSPTSVAGTAYHAALQLYFDELRNNGAQPSLADMQRAAWIAIDDVKANCWRTSVTCPTVEDCIIKATRIANALIANFLRESDIYTADIAEILGVELRQSAWLIVNGVDIPLPCHGIIDLVARLTDGRIVIIDHKSKDKFTDEKELQFTAGKQAITYVLNYEANHPGRRVDEVWFIENKHSANKDGSPQLRRFAITINESTRRLYEAILYEPLRRLMQAASDPDYVYTINDSDMLSDRAELYDFWAKTLLADIDDFNIPEHKRHLIARRTKKIRDAEAASVSPRVIKSFRRNAAAFISYNLRDDMTPQEKIEHILRAFNIPVRVAHALGSYSSVSYLLEVGSGIKIANIAKYTLDIANALNVPSVRILPELVVYDGVSYLCVEVPVKASGTLLWDPKYLSGHALPLGLDNFGRTVAWNLDNHSTPHILVCGATGSGKSVCIRSTIEYARAAAVGRIIIFDPKYEFTSYSQTCEVVNDITDIESRLKSLVSEMQQRSRSGASSLTLIIFDEFADAVSSARSGKELDIKEWVDVGFDRHGLPKRELRTVGREKSLEENLRMLLQKGRSLGYRIMAATQRASAKVITGDAKVNFPVQICFRVPKAIDSKVVLDEEGAESLAGHGDGLIKSPEYFSTTRFQGFYKPD